MLNDRLFQALRWHTLKPLSKHFLQCLAVLLSMALLSGNNDRSLRVPLHPQELTPFHLRGTAQGTTYSITYYASENVVHKHELDSLLNSIDSSLSLYKPYSLVNKFNSSTTGVVADTHLHAVVTKAVETTRQTAGIFDITVYPFTQAWGFGINKQDRPPTRKEIRRLRSAVGSKHIFFDGDKLVKSRAGVQLDPNGIAQGYTVDVIADFLAQRSVMHFLVELGGEIRVKGRKQPGNTLMKIAIESPGEDGWDISLNERIIALEEGAITTSGSYRKFYETRGQKVTHIIDARSGMPAMNELVSVTVFAADAITADAFDNALMVMGLQKAMNFVEARKDISAHFIFRRKDGSIGDTASSRFNKLFVR
jgi:FAD:protein FMN transferase